MPTRAVLRLLLPVAVAWGGVSSALAQCAMCNTAVDGARAGRAFSLSILFLLGCLLAVVAWLVVLAVRASGGRPAAPGGDAVAGAPGLPGAPPPPGSPGVSRGR